MGSWFLLEDGVSRVLLEDGSSVMLLETTAAVTHNWALVPASMHPVETKGFPIFLEDGVSRFLMEDGTSLLLFELDVITKLAEKRNIASVTFSTVRHVFVNHKMAAALTSAGSRTWVWAKTLIASVTSSGVLSMVSHWIRPHYFFNIIRDQMFSHTISVDRSHNDTVIVDRASTGNTIRR